MVIVISCSYFCLSLRLIDTYNGDKVKLINTENQMTIKEIPEQTGLLTKIGSNVMLSQLTTASIEMSNGKRRFLRLKKQKPEKSLYLALLIAASEFSKQSVLQKIDSLESIKQNEEGLENRSYQKPTLKLGQFAKDYGIDGKIIFKGRGKLSYTSLNHGSTSVTNGKGNADRFIEVALWFSLYYFGKEFVMNAFEEAFALIGE